MAGIADPLELKQVTFRHGGTTEPVLKDINLCVEAGEFVGIIGPTGCGKTTLLHLMCGVIPHYTQRGELTGEVRIFGQRTQDLSLAKITQRVGIVLQDPDSQLFNLLVRDELIWGLENRGVSREDMARRLAEVLPFFGIENLKDRITYDLSGGEKQKVALAAIHALRPEVIIFDNPTSQLDPIGSASVIEAIMRIAKSEGRTFVMVEDKIDELVEHADRLILLNDGQILLDCDPRAFCAHEDLLEQVGVRGPQIAQLSYELQRGGVSLDSCPITVEEASRFYGQLLSDIKPPGDDEETSRGPTDGDRSAGAREIRAEGGDGQHRPGRGEETEGQEPGVQPETLAVKVEGLEFVYPPPRQIKALHGLDLEIPRGDFAAIIGQNGSGKTTLAKCISGFLRPTRGKTLVHDQDIHRLSGPERATRAGYVFQNPDHQLFKETVWEDVAFGLRNLRVAPEEIETSVEEVLKLLELWDQRELHPFRLSKGDRQRLAFAGIFVLKPKVLIVDEPTTGQDPVRARQIMDMLAHLNERDGMTILVITHAMELVAEYAKRVIVLAQGKVLLDGSPRQIFSEPETLARTFLAPPPVVQLSLGLGLRPLPLTVAEAKERILEAYAV